MNVKTVWLSSVFGAGVVSLAIAAGVRATPAPVPVQGEADLINGRTARAFESHYDTVFPARTLGINLWGAVEYTVFGEGRPGVVVGSDDWLYTSEEFMAPAGAEARIQAHLEQVAEVREALKRRGSRLIVALVPAKARVYPEHLAARHPDPLHAQLYDGVLAALRARGVTAPDLMQELLQCKPVAPVFLRTDTHWTPAGAQCAAAAVARAAHGLHVALAPMAFRTRYAPFQPHHGDLVKFLGLEPWFVALAPPQDRLRQPRTEPVTPADPLADDAPAPQAVLVGTSYSANARWDFTGALQQALHADVANLAAEGEGPFKPMLEYLRGATHATAPRLVIWEMPERYLPMSDGDATQSLLDPGGTSS
jgi:alginate O-acetyltransferase complex protein AlgJ